MCLSPTIKPTSITCRVCNLYCIPESPAAADAFIAALPCKMAQDTVEWDAAIEAQKVGGTVCIPLTPDMDFLFRQRYHYCPEYEGGYAPIDPSMLIVARAPRYRKEKHEDQQLRACECVSMFLYCEGPIC
jgi:hypothetical protein